MEGTERRGRGPVSIHEDIARTILAGFDKHYRLFREASARAKERFENADWAAAREAQRLRIQMYDQRVTEAVAAVRRRFPGAGDESLWPRIKLAYIGLLYEHRQPECAETFYNSVACRVLHRRYFHNQFIFWRPAISTEYLEGDVPTYRCHYPTARGLRRTVTDILLSFGLRNPFEDLGRDVGLLLQALEERFPSPWQLQPNFQLQVLSSLFFRNKGAYIVGRAINGNRQYPFVVPLLQNARRELYVDTLLLEPSHIAVLFSFARAYFMVDMEVPSAYVAFLRELLPEKPPAEIYTLLGLQKHGKTLFYRDLHHHLEHSSDNFCIAPGIRGLVMLVFTLPSYPYVFKVIRDTFGPPKDMDRKTVMEKYLIVKYHDRVGRLADTLEYSDVALPLARFDPELLEELKRDCASSVEFEADKIIIRHMYIERRMVPLNIYLEDADEERLRHAIQEYGQAIKDLAGADIFPGDLLLKNFGVTRHGRVVFYDYDEIAHMTDCTFRALPEARTPEEELAAEPWYGIGQNDVFPEQFARYVFTDPRARAIFLELHPELVDPAFWREKQRRILQGIQEDVFPYPESLRFCHRPRPPGAEADRRPARAGAA